MYFLMVLAAAQNNSVESFDLPYIRFDTRVLELVNGLGHQQGTKL